MSFKFSLSCLKAALAIALLAGCSGGKTASILPSAHGAVGTGQGSNGTRFTAAVTSGVQAHVRNMAYWGLAGEPSGVPASWMANNVTLLEAGSGPAAAFKAAGGTYALFYADPFRVASNDPMGNLSESAYFHNSSGSRIFTTGEGVTQYAVNPSNPIATSAWSALSSSARASAPFDFIEADNTYFDTLGAFFGFNGSPVELGSQSQWQAAINQLLSASTIPVIVNGMSNEDGPNSGFSGSTMFLSNPNVAGGLNNEGCIESKDPNKTETDWVFDQNTLLNMSNQHKLSICWAMSNAADTNPVRNFFFASWLLSYDPTYSVFFPDIAPNFNKGSYLFVYPEEQIVPTQPLQTAASNISELKVGSVYRREFGMCYQAQTAIGPCETIVNTSRSSSADISSLTGGYVQTMSLTDGLDSYNGGKVGWSSSVPSSLGPHSAVVLTKGAGAAATAPAAPPPTASSTGSANTISGTLVANDGSYLVVNACPGGSYVNAFVNSSTQITTNGLSLSAGTPITVTGTGSCSTSYQATSVVLGSAPASSTSTSASSSAGSISGTIVANDGSYLVVNACPGGSYVNAFINSSTQITTNGLSMSAGTPVTVTGSGSCSTSYQATSIVLGNSSPATSVAPAASASTNGTTLVGTLIANDGSYLVVQGCAGGGYVNAFVNSSTVMNLNGHTLSPGVALTIAGSGSCSTSYQATSVTIGTASAPAGQFSLTGTVHDFGSNWILLDSAACAFEYVDTDSSTVFSGNKLAVGATASVTGSGNCSTRVHATTVSIQ